MNNDIVRRNNLKVFGEGKQPILFAHGFGCDQNMWRFITPAFSDDYQIILFDYVGSGKSDLSAYNLERYGTLEGYAQDILDICEFLSLKDIIFIGHSVSSVIGILASIKNPEYFQQLILIGPSPCYINDESYYGGFERQDVEDLIDVMEKNYLGWSSFFAPIVMQNEETPKLTKELEDSFCSTDPIIATEFAKVVFLNDNRQDLSKTTKPALILQCSDDLIAPVEVGEYVHKNMPKSTIKFMKATGHCPHLSHPQETIDCIKEYLLTNKT
jgi:sigma-B regulation protein RsbQ